MFARIAAFVLLLIAISAFPTPSQAACNVPEWLCLDKTPRKDTNLQQIVADRSSVLYKPGEVADFSYADIKIDCNSAGLERFARQFVDRAWSVGLLSENREFALSVDIEQISRNSAEPPKPLTYLIAQIKRDAGGNTTVTGCDSFLATNISFNSTLKLKFKLLQSKTTTVNPSTYSAIRIVSKVLGFVFAGPGGAAIAAEATKISDAIKDNKSDIDEIVKAFDEVNTQQPMATFDVNEKSVTLLLSDSSKFTISRIGKRSAFLTFTGPKLNAPGAPLQKLISEKTGIDIAAYLTTKAGNWDTMVISTDVNTSRTGCGKIREALGYLFTKEEMIVILAKEFDRFGDATIKDLKDPCFRAIEREALKTMGLTDPLSARAAPQENSGPARDPAKDAADPIRWSSIREFLNEFGRTLSAISAANLSPEVRARKLAPYFDARVATESFDAPDLLPSSTGVLRDSLAAKIVGWPIGASIRYGCFLAPDKQLLTKYSAQMLVLLDSGGGNQRLVNVIVGFTDPKATNVDGLLIGNMLIEKPTAASLSAISTAYKSGCGDRSDPWKPWEEIKTSFVFRTQPFG
ncbi:MULTISPECIES: hypothetical protein [unclassified Bradyrhizobium]|uniref:hypothetical protein n=1 Tax=unclassified Bradyrhizobium TaxID=2631580 RepID=UPI0015CE7A68|nr:MULTISPECIES: hypothetical protein [unclassified Bradyrhizobium]MBB4257381.1 cytidine deaminase [Bradyrhizobium sp. CIR3A]NYG42619.1 cytidine deaminase [Bradyrhizobium sp. IAR9]